MKNYNQFSKNIFLGGTCNNSQWRDELIPLLKINYFNPVVEDWTPECQDEEIKQRIECDFVLYTLTPKMTGFYSICEVIEDSIKKPEKTIFCLLNSDINENKEKISFNDHQIKSFKAMEKMIINNGAICFNNLHDVANYVNMSK